jgi:hypothetical protein
MRLLLLLAIGTLAAGADPTLRPYPDGPILTVSIPDVPALRSRFAASWYGALWFLPANWPVRQRLSSLVDDAEHLSGISLAEIGAHLRSIDLQVGAVTSLQLALDEPASPLLAGAGAAAARDRQDNAERGLAMRAFFIQERRGLASGMGPRPLSIIPCEPLGDGVRIARSRPYPSHPTEDGLLCIPRGHSLICGTPIDPPQQATGTPAGADVSVIAQLPALADLCGIPGLGDACRQSGIGRAVGTLSVVEGGSRESLLMPGARFPVPPETGG